MAFTDITSSFTNPVITGTIVLGDQSIVSGLSDATAKNWLNQQLAFFLSQPNPAGAYYQFNINKDGKLTFKFRDETTLEIEAYNLWVPDLLSQLVTQSNQRITPSIPATRLTTADRANQALVTDNTSIPNGFGLVVRIPGDQSPIPVTGSFASSPTNIQTGAKGTTLVGFPTSTNAGADRQPLDVIVRGADGSINPNTVITANGSLTALNENVTLTFNGQSNTTFQITGTWVGTVQFQASNNNTDWTPIFAYKAGDLNTPSSNVVNSTNNDIYRCTTGGFGFVRAIFIAYGSGTAVINSISTNTTSGVFLNSPLPAGSNLIGGVNNSQIAGTNIDVNTGAATIGTQRVVLANENVEKLYVIGQAAQTATVNNILTDPSGAAATDVIKYSSFVTQIVSTGTGGAYIFEGSNDNVNFATILVRNITSATGSTQNGAVAATASAILFAGECNFRYLRVRISTTITGGSIRAFTTYSPKVYASTQMTATQSGAGNLNANVTGAVTATVASTTLSGGQSAHSAARSGNPISVGGKVVAAVDTTLVNNDASDLSVTTSGQLINKPFATQELDFTGVGLISNSTTPFVFKVAAGANIRNMITSITLNADTLGAATDLVIKDGAIVGTSVSIATPGVFTSPAHDLRVGNQIVFSAIGTITGISINTIYYVATVPSTTTFTIALTPVTTGIAITGVSSGFTFNRILFRTKIQTGGLPLTSVDFPTPLRGIPNGSMDIQTLTASVTGGVYYNIQGYTGF